VQIQTTKRFASVACQYEQKCMNLYSADAQVPNRPPALFLAKNRFAAERREDYPVIRCDSADSTSPLIGTRARIVVPRPGSESITSVPFTNSPIAASPAY
jgi:hypothetical protein